MAGLAAGLHRGQAPVEKSHSQCTLMNASSHVETARKTAQMMFTALACVFEKLNMQDIHYQADATPSKRFHGQSYT